MENIVDHEKYKESRERLEKYFSEASLVKTEQPVDFDGYRLVVSYYRTKERCWNVTRGIVTRVCDGKVIADIKRNYSSFGHLFVHHSNGKDYMLCGEDYQGYTVVNLTDETILTFIPDSWLNGCGFCWVDIYDYDKEDNELRVEGCYWGCPFEHVIYDFSYPDVLPLPEKERFDKDDDEDYE